MFTTIITPSLLFVAFLLLLLVTLSVPIIKTIYLFNLSANVSTVLESASGSVKFGVFGYCTSGIDVGGIISDSVTPAECSKAHLGYTFDSTVASALHLNSNELVNIISKTTTAALVLHPIACALTFVTFLHVKNDTDGDITLNWGNAVWMALGATIALWLAMLGACGGVCAWGSRNRTRRAEKY
ncbi:hypothetical protein BT96DRAFT_965690 [Gymnopus androsaceus JB14]|uniref:Pali-domain-containing protein n=1 Tax=Gymnopus androsaceus JB14 TaxID=1447944 RepID=A0A6A4HNH5_9AGAR|nr:hypothetical protein BT96DRAFT_965690 [Gymnopus androsaceus JB14]